MTMQGALSKLQLLQFFAMLSIYLTEHPESYEEVSAAIEKLDAVSQDGLNS